MTEYTCKKCGEVCEVEFDDDPRRPNTWCDECNDYPGGWIDGGAHDATVDYLSHLYDQAKNRRKYGDM